MTESLKITDVSQGIHDFKAQAKSVLDRFIEVSGDGKTEISANQEVELMSRIGDLADEYEKLILALQGSNPAELTDENLIAFWESLFDMNMIKRLPAGGDLENNLEMFKRLSTARIRDFFGEYQLETIGVDDRIVLSPNGGAKMVLDIVLLDDGGNKFDGLDLPRAIFITKKENGGIFVTLNAEDLPILLAKGGRVSREQAGTNKQTVDALDINKN